MSVSELYRAVAQSVQPTPESRPTPTQRPIDPHKSGFAAEFKSALQSSQQTGQLNLSQHAQTRIQSRSIPWDAGIEKRVTSGIEQARAKGSREALILADNLAVIANVKSNTVVTAMDRSQMKEKIFTNIDSAVIV